MATTGGCSKADSVCEPGAFDMVQADFDFSCLFWNKLEGSERFPQVINVIRAEAQMSLSTDRLESSQPSRAQLKQATHASHKHCVVQHTQEQANACH